MTVTIDYLINDFQVMIHGEKFLSTRAYVSHFVEDMAKKNAKIFASVSTPKNFAIFDDNEMLAFNEVWVQAVLPEVVGGYHTTYHMAYSLRSRHPGYFFFKGWRDDSGRLVIPDKLLTISGDIQPETPIPDDYQRLFTQEYDIKHWRAIMEHAIISRPSNFLGSILDKVLTTTFTPYSNCRMKVGSKDIVAPYISLFYPTGVNSLPEVTLLDYYNAVSEQILSDDPFNVCGKLVLVNSIFQDYLNA